jgi:hypothetical protein
VRKNEKMWKNRKNEETATTTRVTTPPAQNRAVCAAAGVVFFILVLYLLAYSGRSPTFSTETSQESANKFPVVKEKLKVRKHYQSMFSSTSQSDPQCHLSSFNASQSTIHLFVLKSEKFSFPELEETIQIYSELHGYRLQFLLVDSFITKEFMTTSMYQVLVKKYKRSQADLIKTMRSVIISGESTNKCLYFS